MVRFRAHIGYVAEFLVVIKREDFDVSMVGHIKSFYYDRYPFLICKNFLDAFADFLNRSHQGLVIFTGQIPDVSNLVFRDNEHVARLNRVDIHKSERLVVFVDLMTRYLTFNNLGKNTLLHTYIVPLLWGLYLWWLWLQLQSMSEAFAENRKTLVALNLAAELEESRADELGLLVSADDFAQLDLKVALRHQENLPERMKPELADCWTDPRNTFAVVCGTSIFVSRQPVTSFDQVAFDADKPYYTTVIPRPEPEAKVQVPAIRVPWLRLVVSNLE